MKEVLLAGINSRYNHTCLAVRGLNSYLEEYLPEGMKGKTDYVEFTISENILDIMEKISAYNPKMVIFSVYIWNAELSFKIIRELKKIMPAVIIGAGGPEVSYKAETVLQENVNLDFIICQEGEQIITEIVRTFLEGKFVLKLEDKKIFYSKDCIQNLDSLPFAYPELTGKNKPADFLSRIYYYESSRGCPFSCSYCLSSIDKSVRFKSLPKVFEELKIFIDNKIPLVKFVDRTFNLKEERYIAIWEFIRDNWNGVTRFHFEIAAEILSDKALEVINTLPEGLIQFEIGIQTINAPTLEIVGRKADTDSLAKVIKNIPKTVHIHLDLIAGLPKESLKDFERSFDYAIVLRPDMLQLGFLKVLSGTQMEQYALSNNFNFMSVPPYEILSTPDMDYSDLRKLKAIERLVDVFYNSGSFRKSVLYLIECFKGKAYSLFSQMKNYGESTDSVDFYNQHGNSYWFEFILNFCRDCLKNNRNFEFELFYDLLRFDYVFSKKYSTFPDWYKSNYDKDSHHKLLQKYTDMHSTRLAYASSHYEIFKYNPLTLEKTAVGILFLYNREADKPTKIFADII